jgi:hypothetical protein
MAFPLAEMFDNGTLIGRVVTNSIPIGHRTQILTSAWGTYAPHMHNLTQLVTNGLIEGMRAKRAQVPMLPGTVAKGVCAPLARPPPHPSTYLKLR